MEREYTVVYQPIEDGWFLATVPELPGAISQGRTIEEAREMIADAVALLLEGYREQAAESASADATWETVRVHLAAPGPA